MRFAYADPPYIGQAKRHYSHDPQCAEVDHGELIRRLGLEFPDGWALSLSSPTLATILPMCPPRARVLAWVKPFAVFKPNVGLAYTWEPVILYGGRPISREQDTVRDWHSANITLKKGLCGAKPRSFCHWILDCLNFFPSDEVEDLFPGTGIMAQCVTERLGGGVGVSGPLFVFDERSEVSVEAAIARGLPPGLAL